MSEKQTFLKSVHIENYRSLRDVEFPLKPLTVLVGPNASGKSNVLRALSLLNMMMIHEELPLVDIIRDSLWAGEASHITFQLQATIEKKRAAYELEFKAVADNPFVAEKLSVDDVQVISIQNGEGVVWDESGKNRTDYKSNKLALRSAGDYGAKPVTNTLTEFIKGWEVYDFQPNRIRRQFEELPFAIVEKVMWGKSKALPKSPREGNGWTLSELLAYWHKNTPERFHNVSESLAASTNISIDQWQGNQFCLLEGYKNPIPLVQASDGTLRLVTYYILLNLPELPPLIAIEEPERNLHPGALTDIANVLEQIAERTQVIITTHNSQLLDAFNPENLSNSLGVLLLGNRLGQGTEIINLGDIREDQAALKGWMTDFGIGSALFDSGLLQDPMGEPVCQP